MHGINLIKKIIHCFTNGMVVKQRDIKIIVDFIPLLNFQAQYKIRNLVNIVNMFKKRRQTLPII